MDLDLQAISRQVALDLCRLRSESNLPVAGVGPRLVFPAYRVTAGAPPRRRVSEAEARILFCLALSAHGLPFAVEVPTAEQYKFSGSTLMSARTDVVVYGPNHPSSRRLGVEFKAHNPDEKSIRKDLEKLLREKCDGLWFHVLENVDSGSLRTLLKKFSVAFAKLQPFCVTCPHSLTLAVVVLEKRFWLTQEVPPLNSRAQT